MSDDCCIYKSLYNLLMTRHINTRMAFWRLQQRSARLQRIVAEKSRIIKDLKEKRGNENAK